jgi:hypothetical protein
MDTKKHESLMTAKHAKEAKAKEASDFRIVRVFRGWFSAFFHSCPLVFIRGCSSMP